MLIHPLNFLEIRRPPLSYIKAVFIQLSHSHKDENNLYNRFKVILFVYQYVARTQWTGKRHLRSYHTRHLSEYEKGWPHSTRNQSKQEAGRDLSDYLDQSTKQLLTEIRTHTGKLKLDNYVPSIRMSQSFVSWFFELTPFETQIWLYCKLVCCWNLLTGCVLWNGF